MRRVVVATAICLSVVGLSAAEDVHAAIRKVTRIPEQALGAALQELARDRGFQVVYVSDELDSLRTHGASGDLTVDEALEQLLSGTGFTYRHFDSNAVSIVPMSTASPHSQDSTGVPQASALAAVQGVDVAQIEQSGPQHLPLQQSAQETAPKVGGSNSDERIQLEQVTVTGSRLRAVDGESAQPVNVYSSEDIRTSGQNTVADFLNTLPEVSTASSPAGTQMLAGQSSVQLRGLPIGTTLILLNGRRLEPGGAAGSGAYGTTFNLNNIPAAAIDRVEVLPEGSSATYGSNALAGVVNIILKKDLNGLAADVRYGRATGVRDTSASVAGGASNDRGSISIVATFLRQGDLLGKSRAITDTGDYRPFGGPNSGSTSCSPGNVYSIDGTDLPSLSTPQAAIPAGLVGRPTLANFAGASGALNTCPHLNETSLIPSDRMFGALVSGEYDLVPGLQIFSELMYSHQDQHADVVPLEFSQQLVPASNAYNPFGEDVLVSYRFPQQDQITYDFATEFVRPLIGLRGSFAHDWSWEAAAWLSSDRAEMVGGRANTDYATLSQALASSDPAVAPNLFASDTNLSAAQLASLFPDSSGTLEGRSYMAQTFVRGPLLHLPAGDLEVVLGAEYERQQLKADLVGPSAASSLVYDYGRIGYAFFGEARVPLLDSSSFGRLTATLASRYDHSDDFGGKVTSQAGLEWRPLHDFLLRGAWAQAYDAPPLYYLNAAQLSFPVQVTDPRRSNEVYTVSSTVGGSSSLRPETGRSYSAGFVWSPGLVQGLQASVTWWNIQQRDRIALLEPQEIVDNESLFPGRVIRGPLVNGVPGPIESVVWSYINFGDLHVSGVDGSMSYRFSSRVGDWIPSVNVSNVDRYEAAITPDAPPASRVSVASLDAWAPRWKGTAAIAWQDNGWSSRIIGRYVGKYLDYDGVRELGNAWFCDLNVQYDIGRLFWPENKRLSRTAISVGAVNVFDSLPKYSAYDGGTVGYDPQEYDIRGRYMYGQVSVRW